MAIKKEILHDTQSGTPVCRFKIPNQTGDYVELTNLGCSISGIHIRRLDGRMENIAASADKAVPASSLPNGSLWGSALGRALSGKVWEIAEEGENQVLLTCECLAEENDYHVDLRLGLQVTWVNLDRLILDYFITPKADIDLDFAANLDVANSDRTFAVRSFCPTVLRASGERCPVQETEYNDLSFVPLQTADRFVNGSEEIKPMVELSDTSSDLRISVYTTLAAVQISARQGTLSVVGSDETNIELHAGETLANRMIFGFDYVAVVTPEDDDAEPSPFAFFL